MALIDRLEQHRKQRRETISEFASHIGITRHRYWQLKKTGGGLNSEHLLKAASYLGVKPEELVREPEPQPELETETLATCLQIVEPQLPLAIPIIAEGSAGESEGLVDYAYWAPTKVAKRTIKAVRVTGDCLQPGIQPGDTLFIDGNLTPQNGDIVLCLLDGRLSLKRYRCADNNQWLENRYGRVRFEDCQIQGVVIERNERFR